MKTYELLTTIAACLCQQIEDDGSPEPCFCGVVPGEMVTPDYMGDCTTKNGVAWVRLVNSYPTTVVGTIDDQPGNCGKMLGLDIEVGILRSMPIGDRGNPPTAAQKAAATELQMDDMQTIRRAIKCCAALPNRDVLLGLYTPAGPTGGVVGGAWSVAAIL